MAEKIKSAYSPPSVSGRPRVDRAAELPVTPKSLDVLVPNPPFAKISI